MNESWWRQRCNCIYLCTKCSAAWQLCNVHRLEVVHRKWTRFCAIKVKKATSFCSFCLLCVCVFYALWNLPGSDKIYASMHRSNAFDTILSHFICSIKLVKNTLKKHIFMNMKAPKFMNFSPEVTINAWHPIVMMYISGKINEHHRKFNFKWFR